MNRNPHHITTTVATVIATVLAAVTLSACEGIAPEGEDAPTARTPEPIAALTLEDGSEYRFYEPSPGEIAVTVKTENDESPPAMALLESGELSVPGLYRTLAKAEPPVALLDADLRAEGRLQQATLDAAEGRLPIQKQAADDETRVSSALTGAEFNNAYCQLTGWDYLACRINYESVFSVDFFGTQLLCRVHGQIGQAIFVYEAWRSPFSTDKWTFIVDPHENYYVYTKGFFSRRQCAAVPLPNPTAPRPRYDAMAGGDYVL
jgi:hypothetical protein